MARFLDGRGLTEEALEVATDTDYRFELAVQLGKLDLALDIAEEADSESKWRQLAELALSSGRLPVRPPIFLLLSAAHSHLFLRSITCPLTCPVGPLPCGNQTL